MKNIMVLWINGHQKIFMVIQKTMHQQYCCLIQIMAKQKVFTTRGKQKNLGQTRLIGKMF